MNWPLRGPFILRPFSARSQLVDFVIEKQLSFIQGRFRIIWLIHLQGYGWCRLLDAKYEHVHVSAENRDLGRSL